jgi:hypothetical protein
MLLEAVVSDKLMSSESIVPIFLQNCGNFRSPQLDYAVFREAVLRFPFVLNRRCWG